MTASIAALLQPLKDKLAAATPGPWFLNDCEGEVIVLPEADLTMVARDDAGKVVSWGLPTNYRPERRILEVELDSWDEGEDEHDDQIRLNAAFIAAAPTDQAKLIAAIEAIDSLTAELSEKVRAEASPGDEDYEFELGRSAGMRSAAYKIRAALTQALGGDTA